MMEMELPWYWAVLGLDAGSDERTVKRAYARQLKTTRPDEDADAFQRLRAAYEHALGELRNQASMQPDAEQTLPTAALQEIAPPSLVLETIAPATPVRTVILPVRRDANRAPLVRADGLAYAAWTDFLANCAPRQPVSFTLMQSDERLQRFDVRDAFELLALRHAATGACHANLRAALIAHYDWSSDATGLLRRHPMLAEAVFSDHAIDANWRDLLAQAQTNPVLNHLMQDTVPKKLPRRWDGRFIRTMRETLASIRSQHPDLLAHRMNQDVFNWWEAQVADKKYFRQTAGWSSVAGVGMWAALMATTPLSHAMRDVVISFCICQAITMFIGAWAALRPPAPQPQQSYFFGKPLRERRHQRSWQMGWMPPFALLSMGLLNSDPGPVLGSLIMMGMTACAAMAMLTASLSITRVRFCVAFLLSVFTTLLAGKLPAFNLVPNWTLFCFSLCLFTVFFSNGWLLYRMLGLNPYNLMLFQGGWMVASAAVAGCINKDFLPMSEQSMLLMLLVLSGVLIARYKTGFHLLWIGALAAPALSVIITRDNHDSLHLAASILAFMTAFFVAANLLSDAND